MKQRLMKGIAVSPGFAVGPALVVRWELPAVPDVAIKPAQVAGEITRLREALQAAKERVLAVRAKAEERAGPEEARIFDAQLMILDDHDLVDGVERLISDNHFSAERAFELKMLEWRGMWAGQGSTLLRDKLMDLTDVEIRVLTRLMGAEEPDVLEQTHPDHPVILVARDLTPSLTVQLDRDAVLAVATEQGTRTSHAAILAAAIGIPAVVGLREALNRVATGDEVLLDGWAGTLLAQPQPADTKAARARDHRRRQLGADLEAAVHLPSVTTDGVSVLLRSNLDLPEELETAVRHGAEGIGLMRTEFLVAGRGAMPTEEEQVALYTRIGRTFEGRDVIIRTYDLGGDKFPASFKTIAEANPFLGWRAIRVCLDQPEVFRPQVRALLRAAAKTRVRLMIPLVIGVDEVRRTRDIVDAEARALKRAGIAVPDRMPIGLMVETPAAVLLADQLAGVADFLSVGTNDLTQYTLAIDRGNARMADRFSPLHPAVLRALAQVLRAGRQAGIEVSVCGGMASDPFGAFCLLGLGYRVLSVAAPSLPLVRWLVRKVNAADAARVAATTLAATTADEALALVQQGLGAMVDLKQLDPTL